MAWFHNSALPHCSHCWHRGLQVFMKTSLQCPCQAAPTLEMLAPCLGLCTSLQSLLQFQQAQMWQCSLMCRMLRAILHYFSIAHGALLTGKVVAAVHCNCCGALHARPLPSPHHHTTAFVTARTHQSPWHHRVLTCHGCGQQAPQADQQLCTQRVAGSLAHLTRPAAFAIEHQVKWAHMNAWRCWSGTACRHAPSGSCSAHFDCYNCLVSTQHVQVYVPVSDTTAYMDIGCIVWTCW